MASSSSSLSPHYSSHGRGGAGNMADASQNPPLTPDDLLTPTLKEVMVTTGRGGSGNMARNNNPNETRKLQDVEPVARRNSGSMQHGGRGGAGNVFKDDQAVETVRNVGEEPAEEGRQDRQSLERSAPGLSSDRQQQNQQQQPSAANAWKRFFGKKA